MSPSPATPRRFESRPAPGAPFPLDDSGAEPLTGEDLMGDLDPGWLDWRERAASR